ncbi:MAG TPA: hypothetical protein VFA81_03390 [Burkholderiales bacterium]|nr:hypothetical protein [Burkholderiales bacterium]
MATITSNNGPARSTFITVFAWLAIVGSGLMTFISLVQAAMLLLFFDGKPFRVHAWPGQEQLPTAVQFLVSHPQLFVAVFWSLAVLTLVAGIGLLKRKNWARWYFVGVLAFGILWQLGGLWIQHEMLSTFFSAMDHLPAAASHEFRGAETIMSVASVAFAIVACGVFGWLIARLCSHSIRAEFNAN